MSLKADHACLITAMMLFCMLAVRGQTTTPGNADAEKTAPTGFFRIGSGVTPPRVTYQTSPEYSEEARAAGIEGTCVIWLVVGADGNPRNIEVKHKLGLGLDEKAIDAVKNLRFEPGMKDHKPVSVMVSAEVIFHLAGKNETRISMFESKYTYLPEDIASYCAKHPTGFYGAPGTASGVDCSDLVRSNQSKH